MNTNIKAPSIYHSGVCDVCNSAVEASETTCARCGAEWYEDKGDSRMMQSHLSAAAGCVIALAVYLLLLFTGPFWLVFALILVGLGGVPALIYWFGRSLGSAIAHRPKKTHYWKHQNRLTN